MTTQPHRSLEASSYEANRPRAFTHGSIDPAAISPTFQKEILLKPFEPSPNTDGPCHIFDTAPGINLISPDPSFEDDESAMNVSISSSPKAPESHYATYGTIGLPSEYPLQKVTLTFASTILEEPENLDLLLHQNSCEVKRHRIRSSSPKPEGGDRRFGTTKAELFSEDYTDSTILTRPSSPSSSGSNPRHRRQRTELGSAESYHAMIVSTRKRRNHALCNSEFEEHILKELFSEISDHAFSY